MPRSRPSFLHRLMRHDDEIGSRKPFPTASTLLGLAAIMIVLWLLASGLPHFFGTTDEPVSRSTFDTGASK